MDRSALAALLTAMGRPDSVLMGLIRHGLTAAGGILVSRGVIDSSVADQLVGVAIVALGTTWSILAKYVIDRWLNAALVAPPTTTRVELTTLMADGGAAAAGGQK